MDISRRDSRLFLSFCSSVMTKSLALSHSLNSQLLNATHDLVLVVCSFGGGWLGD